MTDSNSMFECHYINLSSREDRKILMEKELATFENTAIKRYDAIDGCNIDYHDPKYSTHIAQIEKHICTPKIIGCGLSHILLCESLNQQRRDKTSKCDYYIIFEDDIRINKDKIPKGQSLNDYIIYTVEKVRLRDKNWDIIKLHNIDGGVLHGSMAAYILSPKGVEKMASMKVKFHIDWQVFGGFNIHFCDDEVFETYDNDFDYGTITMNTIFIKHKIGWFLNQHLLYLNNENINVEKSIYYFLILIFVSLLLQRYDVLISAVILAIIFTIYMSQFPFLYLEDYISNPIDPIEIHV